MHLKVTQIRSAIATKPKHRGTLRAYRERQREGDLFKVTES